MGNNLLCRLFFRITHPGSLGHNGPHVGGKGGRGINSFVAGLTRGQGLVGGKDHVLAARGGGQGLDRHARQQFLTVQARYLVFVELHLGPVKGETRAFLCIEGTT